MKRTESILGNDSILWMVDGLGVVLLDVFGIGES